MTFDSDDRVLMATMGGAQGIRGEVRVRSYTQAPMDLGAYGPLFDANGERFTVKAARMQKDRLIVRFAEIADRTAAEALNGRELFVERDALPDLEDDEVYQDDLVDLAVITVGGEPVGRIVAVQDFGAGEVLEIAPEGGGQTVMIPFSQAAVPHVDLDAGHLTVDPVAAGLDAFMPAEAAGIGGSEAER